MHVVILLAFMAALALPSQVPAGALRAETLLPALLGYWLVTALLAVHDAMATLRSLRGHSGIPGAVLKRHRLRSVLLHIWLVGGMGGLAMLGWSGWLLRALGIEAVPLVGSLLAASPFMVALLIAWWMEYPVHRALRRRMAAARNVRGESRLACWTLREYMLFNLRHNLLFILVPISLILLGVESLGLWLFGTEPPASGEIVKELIYAGGSLGIAACVFIIAPWLLVRIWRTSPLPAGRLRDDLEGLCGRMGVRHRDILVWHSGGVMANAAAMGLVGPMRYALLSDGLLEQMIAPHIHAVFAHEVAHAQQHHIAYAGVFAISAAMCCSAAGWALASLLPDQPWLEESLTVGLLAATWVFAFGFISRRLERQSDVIGAWACRLGGPPEDPGDTRITPEGAAVFAQALQKVAELNGISMGQRNWRHGKMVDRVMYIQALGMGGGTREDIDRTVRRIKRLLLGALVVGLGLLALQIAMAWHA